MPPPPKPRRDPTPEPIGRQLTLGEGRFPGKFLWLWLVIALVLGLWAFGPALPGPFFFDDEHFIVRNTTVQSLSRLPELYQTTVTQSAHIAGNFYRPNQQLVYALLVQIFGLKSALPFHLASLILHFSNTCLVGSWLLILGFSPLVAAVASLFFGVHPVQTEAVAYISGLSDPLCLMFMLLGLRLYSRSLLISLRTGTQAPLGGLLMGPALLQVAALTSKESGVVFLPLAIVTSLYLVTVHQGRWPRQATWALGVFAAQTAVYLGLKFTVLNFTKTLGLTDEVNLYTSSLLIRLCTFVSILWDYALLILYPKDLYYEKPYMAFADWVSPRAAFGLSLLVLSLAILSRVRQWPRVALAVTLFWVGLLPYVGIIPINAIYLEHWLYAPMIGIALGVGILSQKILSWCAKRPPMRLAFYPIGVGILLAMTYRTSLRSREWADPEAFYLQEIAHGSRAARTYNNLGLYYADQKKADQAAHYWRLAIESAVSRPFPQPYHNLARYHLEKGDLKGGLSYLEAALKVDHQFVYSLALVKDVMTASGQVTRAAVVEDALAKTLRGEPYDWTSFRQTVFGD